MGYGIGRGGVERAGGGQILKRLQSEETCVPKKSTFPKFDGPSRILLLFFYEFSCATICSTGFRCLYKKIVSTEI